MKFNEWANQSSNPLEFIKTDYGIKVYNWILNRFYNYELAYSPNAFTRLFNVTIIELDFVLKNLKRLYEKQEFVWGTVVSGENTAHFTRQNEASNSYKGYNVSGDFSTVNNDGSGYNTNTVTSQSANQLDEMIKMLDYDFAQCYNVVYQRLIGLFITLVGYGYEPND